ncbi:MAG: PH domain-containing protein [Alphaproteobacteria bacterium]|nr:PH domain-containing protein [Alphaproteobacteria bacterium]
MSQILRANEYVKIEVHFSYKVFVLPMLFMSIAIILFLMVFTGAVNGLTVSWLGKNFKLTTLSIVGGLCLLIPYIYKRIDNRLKIYAVTNQRVYIRRGIINIREKDIPLAQINDVQISQSIIQRLFGAADVAIQVGNDESRIYIEDINRPREFRDTVINAIYGLKQEEEMLKQQKQREMEANQQYSQPQYPQQQYQYPPQHYSPQYYQPQYPQRQSRPTYQDNSSDQDDYEKPYDPDGGL